MGVAESLNESLAPPLRKTAIAAMVVAWYALMRNFGNGDLYGTLGPFAVVVLLAAPHLQPRPVRRLLEPRWRPLALGALVGVVSCVVTHLAFDLTSAVAPETGAAVADLYQAAQHGPVGRRLAWMGVILLAEEALFRGLLFDALAGSSLTVAAFLSTLAYALAQLGAGSWIVFAMAVVMGSVWSLQRLATQSLVAPVVAHAIWTPTMLLLWPVVPAG